MTEKRKIRPHRITEAAVRVPGSKSHTHRALIAAALADGPCSIENALDSADTRLTAGALAAMGVKISGMGDVGAPVRVEGPGTRSRFLTAPAAPIHLGNSGTSMRLLTAVAALADGRITLTGTERMCQRPIGDLLSALNMLGVPARAINGNGCPPVAVTGGQMTGGSVDIDCGVSSQFLSGLLLIGPWTSRGLDIRVIGGPVSRPYIDLTVAVMAEMGVEVEREGYARFRVPGCLCYRGGMHAVAPDVSNAGYFWAAAALTGGRVTVLGVRPENTQGDIGVTTLLERMGCRIHQTDDGLAVSGRLDSHGRPILSAIDADMADMPDMVPTIGVVAAFARGTTRIRNVAHLRAKESDRLGAVATELGRMGVSATATADALIIEGRGGEGAADTWPHGAEIETYDDHRIAMSFAVAGLAAPGVVIRDPDCVGKSFPGFWSVFESLYSG